MVPPYHKSLQFYLPLGLCFFYERFQHQILPQHRISDHLFVGINLRKARAANALFCQSVMQYNFHFAFLQDPYILDDRIFGLPSAWKVISSENYLAHIIIIGNYCFNILFQRNFYVGVTIYTQVGQIHMCSIYAPPSANFEDIMEDLDRDISLFPGSWIIHGDFNAKSTLWQCRQDDSRGNTLNDIMSKHNFFLINPTDAPPTVYAPLGAGFTDLTWATPEVADMIFSWSVLPDYTASDHQMITWQLQETPKISSLPRLKTKSISVRNLSIKMRQAFDNLHLKFPENPSAENVSQLLNIVINTSVDVAVQNCKIRIPSTDFKLVWWTQDLLIERRRLQALRRRMLRSPAECLETNTLAYRRAAADYKRKINQAKSASWKTFCSQRTGPFDLQYKIWNQKLRKLPLLPSLLDGGTGNINCQQIFTHLFPGLTRVGDITQDIVQVDTDFSSTWTLVTLTEISLALNSLASNKAPGPYGLDTTLLKAIFQAWPDFFVKLFDFILNSAYVPMILKTSTLILLHKKKKPLNLPSSYRPICLAPYFSKLLDKILLHRILHYLSNNYEISSNQFGFTELRNTEQALHSLISSVETLRHNFKYTAIISADISAAFDSITYSDVFNAMRNKGIPTKLCNVTLNFITHRCLLFSHPSETVFFRVARGVPQGSSIGPILWNLVLDTLLTSSGLHRGIYTAYADDINVVIAANSRVQLEREGHDALSIISRWSDSKSLRLSVDKTKVLLMYNTAKLIRPPYFYVSGQQIKTVKSHKILGCIVDSNLTWIPHAQAIRSAIQGMSRRLLSVARNNWGVNSSIIKTWYLNVAERIIVYAAPVWATKLHSHTSRILLSAQRSFALRITKANRHVSTEAVLTLAGLVPIDLVLRKEAIMGRLFRLHLKENVAGASLDNTMIELPVSRWFLHPQEYAILDDIYVEHPAPPPNTIHYYTDGSKFEDKVGTAFCAFQNGICIYTWKAALGPWNTVFQAEVQAILQALLWHLKHQRNASFLIHTDSYSSVMALQKHRQNNAILQRIIQLFKNYDGNYGHVTWVKAHTGILGNELADFLAKSATNSQLEVIETIEMSIPKATIKWLLHKDMIDHWQCRWRQSDKGRFTYKFLPIVSTTNLFSCPLLNLFLTERGPFPVFLHRIAKVDSPECVCSGHGGALHYLFECPLTAHYHFSRPSSTHEEQWYTRLLTHPLNLRKIRALMKWLLDHEAFLQGI